VITYIDGDGALQTLSTDYYDVQTGWPGVINLAEGYAWPTTKKVLGAVKITFVCGYGATPSLVPEAIRIAILMTVGHLYNNRESTIVGTSAQEIPLTSRYLLASHAVSI